MYYKEDLGYVYPKRSVKHIRDANFNTYQKII